MRLVYELNPDKILNIFTLVVKCNSSQTGNMVIV